MNRFDSHELNKFDRHPVYQRNSAELSKLGRQAVNRLDSHELGKLDDQPNESA